MFSLNTGDSLLLMADKGQGIALQPFSYMETLWNAVNNIKNGDKDLWNAVNNVKNGDKDKK